MAKTAKTAAKKTAKKVTTVADIKEKKAAVRQSMPAHPLRSKQGGDGKKRKQLVASAPHFKFEKPGDSIVCTVLSRVIPQEGDFAGKLIGWNVVNVETGEQVMIGNTHQVEKAFTMDLGDGSTVEDSGAKVEVVWLSLSNLGNGRTFNNYEISLIED